MRSQPVLGSASEGGIIMKKLLRWIGYGLLLGCALVGGYCIFLSSGLAERVFPMAASGEMAAPEMTQAQRDAAAGYDRVQLTLQCRRGVTVTNAEGASLQIDPAGEITGDVGVWRAIRSADPDDRSYTIEMALCGSASLTVDFHGQRGALSTQWARGGEGTTLRCDVSGGAMDALTLYQDRRLQITDAHLLGRSYTVEIERNDGTFPASMGCQGRIRGSQQFAFPARNQIQLEGETEKWTLIYQEAPVNYTESWTVPTPKARITALAPAEEKRFAVEAVP